MTILVNLIVCLIVGAAGAAAGWSLRGLLGGRASAPNINGDDNENSPEIRRRETEGIIARLQELAEGIAIDVGAHSESVLNASTELQSEEHTKDEVLGVLARVLQANDALTKKLESAEEKLFEQATLIQTAAEEANTDALTGVNNRRCFDKLMAEAQSEFRNDGMPSCVMMMDVDHFKKFNDTHGHQAGDEVLKYVARTLKRKARRYGQVCRYGGEEFAIIFNGSTIEQCMGWAEAARAAIGEGSVEFEGKTLRVNASAGLAQIQAGESFESQVKRADDSLYHAKEAGRNRGFWNDGKASHPMEGSKEAQHEPMDGAEPEWLVGMSTPAGFRDEVKRRVAEWKRGGPTVSIAMLRIDGWMELIASRGSEAADLVQKATVQFLKASVRDMDNIGNMGDGVFCTMFPSARLENTQKIAERLRSAIARCEVPTGNARINFSVSIGVAELNLGDSPELFIERAEGAMNEASSEGGNACIVHDGDQFVCVTRRENVPS
ncbi:MAG: diguanylate cyclase [Pirellulaceae bacterium]|nr:diguanylate cyclase [Planctomycetales bacterium]